MAASVRRKSRTLRTAAALSLLAVSCRTRKPARFVSLPLKLTGAQSSAVGGARREGTWLWPGEHLRWTIPAGPAVLARVSYHQPPDWAGGGAQELVARVYSGAGRVTAAESRALAFPASFGAAAWREQRIAIPGSQTVRVLEVSLEGDPKEAPPLFIAESTLDWPRPREEPRRRLVVLFDVDTLRSDHVSLYGYGRPTTPHIDATFRSELVADRCYANANWTLPSHVCMMTSTNVNRHRVRERDDAIPPNFPLLAEALAAGGYSTIAVTGGGFVDGGYGFSRGFDRYVSSSDPVEGQVERALRMIDEAPSRSVFLFFHTYQVHDYAPSEASARELLGSTRLLGDRWRLPIAESLAAFSDTPTRRSIAVNRYDAALRRVDDAFGALVGALRTRGLWPDTTVVLTADHGEELFDTPRRANATTAWGHGQPSLYESELAVPLLIRAPGRLRGGHVTEGLSLLDVAPTILDIAGIPPPATFEGRPVRASRTAPERTLFAEAPPYDAVAVRRGFHKAIVRPGFRQSTVDHKLLLDALPSRDCFALDADPGERDGDECREDWAAGLLNEKDRYVAANFPDSLVLRLVREGSGPCEVVASGRMGAPSVRTFAARPTDRVESGKKSSRAEVTVGAGEVWLAFRPTDADRGLSVDLAGWGPVRTVRGAPVERVSPAEWSQLLWRDRLPLPPGDVLLSVAPMLEPIRSSRVAGVPELLARLRALGYLAGGNPDSAPREAPSVRMQEKNTVPVSPGRITVRVR